REFWTYYRQQQPLTEIPRGRWEGHFLKVKVLHSILAPASKVHEQHPDAWPAVKDIEARLRAFFQNAQVYGPLSRSVFERVYNISRAIDARCRNVVRELNQFHKAVRGMPVQERERAEIQEAVQQLYEIRERLGRDLKELEHYEALAK